MKKNSRIAFIGNPTLGTGLWRYAYETKKQIEKIIPNIDELNLNYQKNGIELNGKLISRLSKFILDYKYFWYVRNQSKIPRYPLYHIANQNLSFLNVYPKIVTVYDIFHVSHPRSIQEKLFGMFMYSGIHNATHIIAGSEHTKKEIIKYYHVDPAKITPIYAGVAETYFQKKNKKKLQAVKDLYALPSNIPLILHVSNEQKHKNFDKILIALHFLKSHHLLDNFLLIKVGKPQYSADRKRHEQLIKQYHLENYVRFVGFVPDEDLPTFYQLADVFVFPSEREGFGLPIIEAMASGCPVTASNTSSIPEVAGGAAIEISPSDTTQLAKAISSILSDKKLRKRLIAKGLMNAKKFTWKKTAVDTHKIYQAVWRALYV